MCVNLTLRCMRNLIVQLTSVNYVLFKPIFSPTTTHSEETFIWNLGKIICVICKLHLRWVLLFISYQEVENFLQCFIKK